MKKLISTNKSLFSDTLISANIVAVKTWTGGIRGYIVNICFMVLFLVGSSRAQLKNNIPMKENLAWLEEQLNSLNQGKNYKLDGKKKFAISNCEFKFSHRIGNERTGLSVNNSFPLKDIATVQYSNAGGGSDRSFDLQIVLDKSASGNSSAFSPYVISLYTSDEALVKKVAERLELAKRDCKSAK